MRMKSDTKSTDHKRPIVTQVTVQSLRERIKQDEESKTETTMEAPPNENESAQNHKEEESSETEATKSKTDQFVKILGIYWDVIRDEFHFDSLS